jgi:hypothetical protein
VSPMIPHNFFFMSAYKLIKLVVFNENTEALLVLVVEKFSFLSQLVTTIGVQLSQGCCWNIQ